jgi:putative PIN family toxin of toxin-antitoxin system
MRVVADTNTVVSALLWHGAPRLILDAAREGRITLFTTGTLLAELHGVLLRPKFKERLEAVDVGVDDLAVGYAALAVFVQPAVLDPVIQEDPEDDAVLACAVAASADAIVSGDSHLLRLKQFRHIRVLHASQLLEMLR